MKRHYLPALLTIGLLATLAAMELRHAYDEGRRCRERGGVDIESDDSGNAIPEKSCTADY